jgi:hypothetical protein
MDMIDGVVKIAADKPMKAPKVTLDFRRILPSEAGFLANSPSGYIRWLRQLGLIDQSEGQAEFDAFSVAHLAAMRLIAYRSGPQKAQEAALTAAHGIVNCMMNFPTFYAGDHKEILKWDQSSATTIEASTAASALIEGAETTEAALEEIRRAGARDASLGWNLQTGWIKKHVFRKRKAVPEGRYLCWWSDVSMVCTDRLEEAFDTRLGKPMTAGDVLVLDFLAIAEVLMSRADSRPFLNVHIAHRNPNDERPNPIRRT